MNDLDDIGRDYDDPAAPREEEIPSLPAEWVGFLEEVSADGASRQDQKVYRHPGLQDQVDSFTAQFRPARIAEEAGHEAVVGNVARARRRLRSTVATALDGLKAKPVGGGEHAATHTRWADSLRRRWERLEAALDDGSDYVRAQERQLRNRWEDAHRSSTPRQVIFTCFGLASLWSLVAAGVYAWGFGSAARGWQGIDPWTAGLALLRTPRLGTVLVVLLAATCAIWLAYRWLVLGRVEEAAEELQEHVRSLGDYGSLRLPLSDTDSAFPSVPSIRPAVVWWGLPSIGHLGRPRVLACLLVAILLWVPFYTASATKRPHDVMARIDGCRDFQAMVIQQRGDRLVFLADLADLVDEKAERRFGTLVLSRNQLVAMAEGAGDRLLSCPSAIAEGDGEGGGGTRTGLGGGEEEEDRWRAILVALGLTGDHQVDLPTDFQIRLEDQLELGPETLSALAGSRTTVVRVPDSGEAVVKAIATLREELATLNKAVSANGEGQDRLLAALGRQQQILEAEVPHQVLQSARANEMLWISRLELCLATQNHLARTWKTLTRGRRGEYVGELETDCETIYEQIRDLRQFEPSAENLATAWRTLGIEPLKASGPATASGTTLN